MIKLSVLPWQHKMTHVTSKASELDVLDLIISLREEMEYFMMQIDTLNAKNPCKKKGMKLPINLDCEELAKCKYEKKDTKLTFDCFRSSRSGCLGSFLRQPFWDLGTQQPQLAWSTWVLQWGWSVFPIMKRDGLCHVETNCYPGSSNRPVQRWSWLDDFEEFCRSHSENEQSWIWWFWVAVFLGGGRYLTAFKVGSLPKMLLL